ncbi:hypothetical protein [Treponema endosymbiont of Eucomonympha sp.]|uniref:hypothetical protein n=1 Tax=Treponema endosymbiont of Eucomonympha sp. TaxID=1580831 RepID=UPI000781E510|nr:hypothetical protein [Treponema endosymbiont of Eucomonympha sp.]
MLNKLIAYLFMASVFITSCSLILAPINKKLTMDEAARRARKDREEYAGTILDFNEERKFDLGGVHAVQNIIKKRHGTD